MDTEPVIQRFVTLAPFLNERMRRLVAAAEARALGWGGVTAVAKATGVSRRAIAVGLAELDNPSTQVSKRIRKEGAGRKKTVVADTRLQTDLESLVEPLTMWLRGEC